MPKISVGRSDEDFEEHGLKGTGVIGRHLVGENEEAHKANPIHFDLAKPHVVGLFGKRGTGKCLLPGQKIVTQNGLEDIEKVFERGRDKGESAKVTRSEELYFCDGDTVQSISSRFESKSNDITAVYRKRVDEKLVKITTSSGRTVKVTQDHPLLSLSGWRNSETFSKGERIAVPRSIDLEFSDKNLSIPDDLEEAGSGSLKGRERRLPESREGKLPDPSEGTGYFHEEPGTAEDEVFIHEESGAVSLTQKGKKVLEDRKKEDYSRSGKSRPIKSPKEVSEELAEFLSLLMAEGHEQKTTKKNYRIIFTSENHRLLKRFEDLGEELFGLEFSEMDENSIYTNSRALEELLRCNGYPTSENSFNREVPNFILASRKEVNREFLQKYFDLEGHVTDRQIELSTDRRDIADSITYMLLRFGIVAGVTVKEKYVANTEESKVREHFQLTVSGTQNLKNFKENIDFSIDKKSDKLSKIIEDSNKNVDTVPCGNIIKRCRKKMGADRTQVSEHRESLKAYEDGGTPPRRDKLDQIVEDLRSHHRKVSELFEKTKKEEKIDAAEDLVEVSNVRWKELITEPDISGSEEHLSHEKYRNNPEKIIGPLTDLFESKHDLEESRRLLRKLERLADSDIYWDEIEKIEEIDYEGWVYDITVEENHSFVGGFGGIYCHNSYSMGTLAEELQTSDVSDNCSTIIIDPMGIYWSMKRPNDRAATMLEDWGLNPDAFDAEVFIPEGKVSEFEEREMPYDRTFTLNPADLTAGEWGMAFDLDMNSEAGILLERAVGKAREKMDSYGLEDLMRVIKTFDFPEKVQNRLENRLMNAQGWGIFGEESSLDDFMNRGELSVIDVSAFGEMREGSGVRSLVVGLLAKKILRRRMTARRIEEIDEMEGLNQNEMPIVWMMIDEAHEFLPADGETAASHPLMRWVKIGREPGVSLVLATQQPAKLNPDALSQCDVILSHRLTSKQDIDSLGEIMHTYMRHDVQHYIDALPDSKGAGLLLDDNSERIYPIQMRPRKSWHAGGTPDAFED